LLLHYSDFLLNNTEKLLYIAAKNTCLVRQNSILLKHLKEVKKTDVLEPYLGYELWCHILNYNKHPLANN